MLDALLMPLPIAVVLVGAGLLARRFGRQRTAFIALASGCGIAFASTLGPVANGALHPLEKRYPAILDATDLATSPRYIAVLGSGYNPRDGLPVTAALDAVGVVRLTEGLRLYRQLPKSVLIVSGGAAGGHPPTAEGYARAAIALGVPAQVIMVLDTPINTAAEIRLLHERLGSAPVLLVTSAAHMPRAMALCERIGLRAIAAPTGQMARAPSLLSLSTWLPSAEHLRMTETAIHEYLGLFALSLGLA
jgi:uncharacterized SAM-binding protein YcdF (DUF218 family)